MTRAKTDLVFINAVVSKIYTAHFYDFSTNFLLDSWLVCGSLPLVKALKNDLMHFFSSMKDEAIGNSNLSLW